MPGRIGEADLERYRALAQEMMLVDPEVTFSQMFGAPCVKVSGKIFSALVGGITFKVPPDAYEEALRRPGARPFEPMPGRVTGGWVQLPLETAPGADGAGVAPDRAGRDAVRGGAGRGGGAQGSPPEASRQIAKVVNMTEENTTKR